MDSMLPPLYPLNKSLQEEIKRLFSEWLTSHHQRQNWVFSNDDVTTDFRLNGQDSEYCPEFQLNNGQLNFFKLNNISPNSVPEVCIQPKKRSKKQGCPFCKNNGEEEEFYKKHTLRDSEGRTSCPILRAYTCPICNASGDEAHTIKYCPKNKQPQNVAVMTSLKNYRNAIGQIRTKAASSSI